jgi:hypothetical protein
MTLLVFSQPFEFSVGLAENTKELPTLQGKKIIVVKYYKIIKSTK